MSVDKWCSSYPNVYHMAFDWGSEAAFLGWLNPWGDCSFLIQFHNAWIVGYLLFCFLVSTSKEISPGDSQYMLCTTLLQGVYLGLLGVGRMRRWTPLQFFNPQSKWFARNISAFALFFSLFISFITRCAGFSEGCFSPEERDGEWKTAFGTYAQSGAYFFLIFTLAMDTPSISLLVEAVFATMPTLYDQFGLFITIYFMFSGAGIAFFCGLITQRMEDGGPGYWGQEGHEDTVPDNYTMQELYYLTD